MTHSRIIILGPPGSGKGTQSKMISQHYNIYHISTGEILRSSIKSILEIPENERTNTQLELVETMDSGNLVPDSLIAKVLKDFILKSNLTKFLLDGYPRTLNQAKEFDYEVDLVLFMDTTKDACINRIINRNEGRSDDSKTLAEHRFSIYEKDTKPILRFYKEKGVKVCRINGDLSIEEVKEQIFGVIDDDN